MFMMPPPLAHSRQYYHTHTHLPVLEDEYDSDSEAEDTPQWVKSKMMQVRSHVGVT